MPFVTLSNIHYRETFNSCSRRELLTEAARCSRIAESLRAFSAVIATRRTAVKRSAPWRFRSRYPAAPRQKLCYNVGKIRVCPMWIKKAFFLWTSFGQRPL